MSKVSLLDSADPVVVLLGYVARGGKRRKAKDDLKEEYLRIRVTDEQKQALEAAARRDTLDFSAWARRVLLKAAGWTPDADT